MSAHILKALTLVLPTLRACFRFEAALVQYGFGLSGPEHAVRVQGVNGVKEGTSTIWLFPRMAERIFNLDETNVSGSAIRTKRSKQIGDRALQTPELDMRDSQLHTTFVGVMSMPEYKRDAYVQDGVQLIPPVDAKDAAIHPGQVRSA